MASSHANSQNPLTKQSQTQFSLEVRICRYPSQWTLIRLLPDPVRLRFIKGWLKDGSELQGGQHV